MADSNGTLLIGSRFSEGGEWVGPDGENVFALSVGMQLERRPDRSVEFTIGNKHESYSIVLTLADLATLKEWLS